MSTEEFEFLKLEYEKAAERYNNIYQSVWTIFSYMSAVSAGLIAFGADRLSNDGLVVLASIPLVFWFWSTYLPLDRYGNRTLSALKDIEDIATSKFQAKYAYFSPFASATHSVVMRYFSDRKDPKKHAFLDAIRRARTAIFLSFFTLHCFSIYSAVQAYRHGFTREKPKEVSRVEVTSAAVTLSGNVSVPSLPPQQLPSVKASPPPSPSNRTAKDQQK